MRIGIIVNLYPRSLEEPIVSGEMKNPFYLSQALRKLGHTVFVVSHNSYVGRWDFNNVLVYNVGGEISKGVLRSFERNFKELAFFSKFLSIQKVDIIHSHIMTTSFGLILKRKIKLLEIPIITTAHGTQIPELYANIEGYRLRKIAKLNGFFQYHIDKFSYANSDKVISVSRYQVKEMLEIYRVPKDKIRIIPNGVDTSFYKPNRKLGEKLKEKLGLTNKRIILFVGRLVRKKGIRYLVQAAPNILKEFPDAIFLLIGGTDYFADHEAEIRQLINKSKYRSKFILIKAVPEKDMPMYYNSADVLVVPSINYESAPTVIFEGMACGLPIVATNRWGIPEQLGYTDTLVPEKNSQSISEKIIRILKDDTFREFVSMKNRRRALKFDIMKIAKMHLKLYKEVLQGAT